MLEIISTYIEQHRLLPEDGRLVVAVSGGADSLCLLHILQQLCGSGKRYSALQLHVAHLNHQLRGVASERDAEEVARIATAWGLPVTLGTVDVPALARREQRSLEDAARTARYRFLRSVAQGGRIAVAHHMDDQAETLILHWLRGGGIASMIGLQPYQQDIIRPLLAVTRADTVTYCAQHHITPLEDISNSDTRFLRNRIRHELLPLLSTINPGIRATLLRTAEIMQEDYAWIEQQVNAHWPAVVSAASDERIEMQRGALQSLPLSLQRHLLRHVTARLCAGQSPLELRHYKLLEQLLQHRPVDELFTLHLPQQLHATLQRTTLTFTRISNSASTGWSAEKGSDLPVADDIRAHSLVLPIPGRVPLPHAGWLAVVERVPDEILSKVRGALEREDWRRVWYFLDNTRYSVYIDSSGVGDSLSVRTRRPGDRVRPLGLRYEKKVQDILVDKHISRAERERIPLFFSGERCLWLAGICLDDRVRLTATTRHILRLSIEPLSEYPSPTMTLHDGEYQSEGIKR